jgi:predicted DNA-binding antitoxin AbrB/MazE fold protein
MQQTINAVYKDGVFKPLKRLKISNGQKAKITLETFSKSIPDELLDLAGQVYDGLSEKQIDDIEQIAFNR